MHENVEPNLQRSDSQEIKNVESRNSKRSVVFSKNKTNGQQMNTMQISGAAMSNQTEAVG